MSYAATGLRDAFEGQGEAGFMAWTYVSYDPLETILAPGYFNSVSRFEPGDLVFLGTRPRPAMSPWTTQHQGKETRRALLMVRGRGEDGQMRVRLVQDYGRPEDPDGVMQEPKRGRGRPKARPE